MEKRVFFNVSIYPSFNIRAKQFALRLICYYMQTGIFRLNQSNVILKIWKINDFIDDFINFRNS